MIDAGTLAHVVNGLVGGLTTIVIYLLSVKRNDIIMKRTLAELIILEIRRNRKTFSRLGRMQDDGATCKAYDMRVYGGLFGSANMRYLDQSLRKKIGRLYDGLLDNRQDHNVVWARLIRSRGYSQGY